MKKLIVANWKMNLGTNQGLAFAQRLRETAPTLSKVVPVLCPPTILLRELASLLPLGWRLGAQDCSTVASGARTGDTSAAMLKDAGCAYVILGHSERRLYHNETNEEVATKARVALEAGLIPLICVGETKEERAAGRVLEVIHGQLLPLQDILPRCVVAYEPRWAIGTGVTPSPQDIALVHGDLETLGVPVLYGGSVDATNAGSILAIPGVGGLLIGGASMTPAFIDILAQAEGI